MWREVRFDLWRPWVQIQDGRLSAVNCILTHSIRASAQEDNQNNPYNTGSAWEDSFCQHYVIFRTVLHPYIRVYRMSWGLFIESIKGIIIWQEDHIAIATHKCNIAIIACCNFAGFGRLPGVLASRVASGAGFNGLRGATRMYSWRCH